MPALNFQPPREGAAESDEQPKTPDRSKWKPAILDQFAEMCTFFYRSGHFMYGPRFDIIGKCLEAAKAIGIDIDEKEMITAARGACIEKILAEGTSNSYYNIDLCAEYELRADELGCKKATYSAEFLDIIRAKIARRFGSKGDYTEIPSLVRFAQKIGVDVHQNSG